MKKVIGLILSVIIISFNIVFAEENQISAEVVDFNIVINSEKQELKSAMLLVNERTYLPVREVAELLNLYVVWNDTYKTIRISDIGIINKNEKSRSFVPDKRMVNAQISDFQVKIDGYIKDLKNKVIVVNDTSYLPLREVSEILELSVDWNDNSKTVFIIKDEKEKEEYDFLLPFNDDNGLYGYMDETGKIVVEPTYKHARNFSEGMGLVEIETGYFGYIDATGNQVIPCIYEYAYDFSDGLAAVEYAPEESAFLAYKYIDRFGNTVIDKDFLWVGNFNSGFAPAVFVGDDKELHQAYIDMNGKIAAEFTEGILNDFDNGYAEIQIVDNIQVINTDFEVVFDYKQYGYDLSYITTGVKDNKIIPMNQYGKWGMVDINNKAIVSFKYDALFNCSEGLMVFHKDDKTGYIDLNDNVIIEPQFVMGDHFVNGVAVVMKSKDDYSEDTCKISVINKYGQYIKEDIEVDNHWPFIDGDIYSHGLRQFYIDDKIIYINSKGDIIKPNYNK